MSPAPSPHAPRPSVQVLAWAAAKSATLKPAFCASPSLTHGSKSAGARFAKVRQRLVRSPFGSISKAGTPARRASSMSTMPRPVLPEPVMPTITPSLRTGGVWIMPISEARSRLRPAVHSLRMMLDTRMCSRLVSGSASMPTRPSSPLTNPSISSPTISASFDAAGGWSEPTMLIPIPADEPGV